MPHRRTPEDDHHAQVVEVLEVTRNEIVDSPHEMDVFLGTIRLSILGLRRRFPFPLSRCACGLARDLRRICRCATIL